MCLTRLREQSLPLTLTLSPQAGRGDVAYSQLVDGESGAANPFSPFTGRRWRQPDEGRPTRPEVDEGRFAKSGLPKNANKVEMRAPERGLPVCLMEIHSCSHRKSAE
ncbi:hypothetical protein ACO34A_17365 [Rhizobium sp. ACO-34A]|nr:hypothetical protein ACO34A_17365 [Rhizobium sp. ACO-34A]